MGALLGLPSGLAALTGLFGLLALVYLVLLWAGSVLWVSRDVRSRSDDATTHMIAVAIAVIFPLVGLPIYFVLRPRETFTDAYDRRLEEDALLAELHAVHACPNCRRPVQEEFALCAYCGTALKQPCGQCGRSLLLAWHNCPYCGFVRPQARQQERRPATAQETDARPASPRAAALDAIRRAASRAASEVQSSARRGPREDVAAPAPRVAPRPRPRTDEDEDDR